MDIFDRAQEADAEFRRQALERQRKAGAMRGESLKECIDCGEEIPATRRLASPGCLRCLDCQQVHEEGR